MNQFELAKQKGVSSVTAQGFMPFMEKNGRIAVDFGAADAQLAQDAAITTPNAGVPSFLTTFLDPLIVPILFAAQNSTKVYGEQRKGSWADKTMAFTVTENAGNVTPYSDYAEDVSVDVNAEYPERDNYVFQAVLKYGERELEIFAKSRLNLVSQKQQAASYAIAAAHNRINLFGVAGKRVYGMLNDPSLPTTLAPISVSGNSTWEDKRAYDAANVALLVYNDIQKMWASLCAKNGGHIDETMEIVLALAPESAAFLTIPNQYGLSAETLLKKTFPNLRIVQLPELATNAGNMAFMTIPQLLGIPTAFFAFSEKARFMNVVPQLSAFKQKVAGGTYGCVYTRPNLVCTMTGI